jgi:hypothetical protein
LVTDDGKLKVAPVAVLQRRPALIQLEILTSQPNNG